MYDLLTISVMSVSEIFTIDMLFNNNPFVLLFYSEYIIFFCETPSISLAKLINYK